MAGRCVVAVEPQTQASDGRAGEFQEIAPEQALSLREAIIEVARERRQEDERKEKDGAEEHVLAVDLLLRDLAGEQLEREWPQNGGQKEIVAERSEKLSGEQERVIAFRSHGWNGHQRIRTANRGVN